MSEAAKQDAPATSEAHQKFVYKPLKNSMGAEYRTSDGKRVDINIFVSQAGNNMEEAARICRFLYHKLETGSTKEEVFELKKTMLAAVAQSPVKRPRAEPAEAPQKRPREDEGTGAAASAAAPARQASRQAAAAAPPAAASAAAPARQAPPPVANASSVARAPMGPPPFPQEDVPDDSNAHRKVLWHRTEGNYYCYFRVTLPGGRKFQQQVTCDAKSESTAARLCRLIYQKWEKGASEDAVKVYRGQVCAAWNAHRQLGLVKDDSPGKAFFRPDKKEKHPKPDKVKGEKLGEGSLDSLSIGDAKETSAAWTRVWWHQSRCHWFFRWNSDKANDRNPITFQVTERSAHGNKELAARICRLCFEKIEAGGTKEDAESLKRDLVARCGAELAAQPRSSAKAAAPAKAAAKAAKAAKAAAPAVADGAAPDDKGSPGEEKGEDSPTEEEEEGGAPAKKDSDGDSSDSSSGSDSDEKEGAAKVPASSSSSSSDSDAAPKADSDDDLFEKEGAAQASVATGGTATTENDNLPPGWQMVHEETYDAYYYYNPTTGESQWEMPTA